MKGSASIMINLIKSNIPSLFMALFGIIILIIIPFEVRDTGNETFGPRFLPYLAASLVVILSILSIFEQKFIKSDYEGLKKLTKKDYFRLFLILITMIAWFLLISWLGFILTTILFTISVMYIIGNRKIWQLIVTPLLLTFVIYFVFNELLNVILPTGVFL